MLLGGKGLIVNPTRGKADRFALSTSDVIREDGKIRSAAKAKTILLLSLHLPPLDYSADLL